MDAALSLPALPAPRLPPLVERLRHGGSPRDAAAAAADEGRVDPAVQAKLRRSASEFEAMFIGQMLTPLFDSLPVDDQFGGGKGEEMFRGLLVQEYGKQIMARGGFGLADQVYRELLRAQEASHGQG
ncbi:rod-binding protein [Azospirillum halopraeferens]|uniref:rod-binding protein n=1 Tax=Azospirillum halopraeferens TaxID=34010 RepID=UPI0003FA1AC4|nr:rod-binding protein [Azospirillum halopraeferens]